MEGVPLQMPVNEAHVESLDFSKWLKESLPDLWSLFSNFSSNEQDFVELVAYVKRKIDRRKVATLAEADHCFYKLWSKRFRLDRQGDLEFINLFLLFFLKWSVFRVSAFTGQYISKVYFVASQGIREQLKDRNLLERAQSKDCGKVDLYTSEFLIVEKMGTEFERKNLEKSLPHLRDCDRCSKMLVESRAIVESMAQSVFAPMPNFVVTMVSRVPASKPSKIQGFSRSKLRPFLGIFYGGLVVLMVALVVSVPYYAKINFSFPDFANIRENLTAEAVFEEADEWVDIAALRKFVPPPWELVEEQAALETSPTIENLLAAYQANVAGQTLHSAEPDGKAEMKAVKVEETPRPEAVKVEVARENLPRETEPLVKAPTRNVFYRWGAYSSSIEADVSKIRAWLEEFQGIQSGELPLGADYRGGKYFHFEIPSDKFSLLMDRIKNLGLGNFTNVQAKSTKETKLGHNRVVFLVIPSKN